jgi:hypothetical protein
LENKEWPGWCFYHPWDLQDGAGTGSTEYRRKWVYRSLPEMATLPWKVHCPPGWICREILKNKVPPISYSFCFIGPFAFVIEHETRTRNSFLLAICEFLHICLLIVYSFVPSILQ